MPQVVIARVNGFCYTGALELALACDLIVTADEAKFADTHAKWGLRPTWGMSQRLIRLVGISRARELSYTAQPISGPEAAAWGLATRSVPRRGSGSRRGRTGIDDCRPTAPDQIAAYKDLYRQALDSGLTDGPRLRGRDRLPDHRHRRAGWRHSDNRYGRIVGTA